MSKRAFRSQASSSRVGGGFEGFGGSGFGASPTSVLSYVQEPPDYSTISDPQLVVTFKNLSKKDGTTKAKALEDLQAHVSSSETPIDDGVLDAWAKLFPRLSIDISRRVRQLSHMLNGPICHKCGKRSVRHLQRLSGPWLAGTQDSDRATARAAQEALCLVFPTSEKIHGVHKTFQGSILEFCRDAVLHETVKTLSDERVVSADDAEALYARVVSSSLLVIAILLRDLTPEDQAKHSELHEEILSSPKFWELPTHPDAGVRRAVHRLVQIYLKSHLSLVRSNVKPASTAYVYKGLASDQTGSAVDYEHTLNALTTELPEIWTDAYSGKKSVALRLKHFLKLGSQGSSTVYWGSLASLLRKIPVSVFPQSTEELVELLSAARAGLSLKDERFNAPSAWPAYFTLVDLVTMPLAADARDAIFEGQAMPLVTQFLDPGPETADWAIGGAKPATTVSTIARIRNIHPKLLSAWPSLGTKLIETARASQPAQSKDFDRSQKYVAANGERWASLQRELFSNDSFSAESVDIFVAVNTTILRQSVDLLAARNGKPYGAAAIIEELLRTCGPKLLSSEDFRNTYTAFAEGDMPSLILSPAQRHLVHGLYAAQGESFFRDAFACLLLGLLKADAGPDTLGALKTIFSGSTPKPAIEVAKDMEEFQDFLTLNLLNNPAQESAPLLAELVRLGAVSAATIDAMLSHLTSSLIVAEQCADSLTALNLVAGADDAAVKAFMSRSDDAGGQLLPRVLSLEQSADDATAEKATTLASKLSSVIGGAPTDAKFSVVLQNLERLSERSLTIDAVNDLTERLLESRKTIESPSEMIPSLEVWSDSLSAVMRPPKASLATSTTLGGAIHFVTHPSPETTDQVRFDAEGLSQPLRIAMYLSRLMAQTDLSKSLDDARIPILTLLHISVLVAEANISVVGDNSMWRSDAGPEAEAMVLEFTLEANEVLRNSWANIRPDLATEGSTAYSRHIQALESLRPTEGEYSPWAYYSALAFAKLHQTLFELHGHDSGQGRKAEEILRQTRSRKNVLKTTSCIAAFSQPLAGSQTLNRVCNELVADLTAIDIESHCHEGLEKLAQLSVILSNQEDAVEIIAKQRLIFLVKHLLPWLQLDISAAIKASTCVALSSLLPGMHDMYGEHWGQALEFVLDYWSSTDGCMDGDHIVEDTVLLSLASIRLFAVLKKLSKSQDPNDDLTDIMKERGKQIRTGLLRLLQSENGAPDEAHLPLMTMHELLARQIAKMPFEAVTDIEELYVLMYTPSHAIQQAAFDILHQSIPKAQEQVSLDAALDDKTALLPDELLSLVLEAPSLDSLADASFDRRMPLALQGYLHSWRLIFDFFGVGASYRVKSDYIEQLKEGGYLAGLLALTFDFLGHSRGKPIDASKFDIENYTADAEPSPERDVQWLLTHLYFLALTHVPSLAKAYYLEVRSRQTAQAVESWTARHISPVVAAAALDAVARWAADGCGAAGDDDGDAAQRMSVRVAARSREVNVGYVVDEQTMAIRVVLPPAFPLDAARVIGVSRVAVKEERWQSWLRACQGVITFSNGSIIDGLAAWRRNVSGALRGQTECAICYSIISADRQLPTKRCPTCRHLFHASCLLKWFKTSAANTCPLCRNAFNFH